MLCGIPNALLSRAMRGNCSYHLETCDTFTGIHNCAFLRKLYTKAGAFIKMPKNDQIKNEPIPMDDCANYITGCRSEIAAIFLVPIKSITKSSRGFRRKPSILSEFHSAILAEILKYSIGIAALL